MLKNIMERSAWSESGELTWQQVEEVLDQMLTGLPDAKRILLVPPDITRCYSGGGMIAAYLYKKLRERAMVRIMPAVGTHRAMSREEQVRFFGEDVPEEVFLYHNWQEDTVGIGTVPGSYCREVSGGRWQSDIEVRINHAVVDKSFDLILSIGQVVPHEVIGMSNYTKNMLVGLGGRPMINGTHLLGAMCNMEKIMGNTDSPVRAVFDYGEEHFLGDVPLAYILTVASEREGNTVLHGVFTGASRQVYEHASELAAKRSIIHVGRRAKKVVAYLEPEEFSTMWVGNKSIYRTRMIMEDGGELLVIAPGIRAFGENPEVDGLIRRYGYRGTPCTMELVEKGVFSNTTMVPAHMIHSSSEGRFRITYAVDPQYLTGEEIRQVGYEYMNVKDALARYPLQSMQDGWQTMEDGEEVYVVKAPALGLWKV